jgi:ABC-2 type transport system permease protein
MSTPNPPVALPSFPPAALAADATASRPMPALRVLCAYLAEIRFEVLRMSRAPIFVIPFLALPILIYLLFGVIIAGAMPAAPPSAAASEAGPWADFAKDLASYLFVGLAATAVAGPALFCGAGIAIERDLGMLRLKRAQPLPPGAYLLAKLVTQLFFCVLAAGAVACIALFFAKVTFSPLQVWIIVAVLVAGTVPLCALGLFIGTHVPGAAAPGLTQVVYFPMLYLSGLYFPLPAVLAKWAVIWPLFHMTQLAYAAVGMNKLVFVPPLISLAVLVGVTVIFGGLALNRVARRG